MATPNYSYEKRQRELAKKRKTEEKKQRKLHKADGPQADETGAAPDQDQQALADLNPPAAATLPGSVA